ncbi:MAG: serine hydrolase domain-containing protein [Ilumatobacteraceae bacterium]
MVRPDRTTAVHGDSRRRFRLASISKTLTAWACLIAIEEGSVSLSDPVGPPGSTLRHLLCHAAGFGFDSIEPITGVERRRIYSNAGIECAASHVADRTGMNFATYLQEAVFEPLQMNDTSLDGSPAHAVFSTVVDLLKFISEVQHPALVSAASRDEALSIQFPTLSGLVPGVGSFSPNPWGLGFEIHGTKAPHWMGTTNSAATVGHFGGSGTMMWIDPVQLIGMAALTDRNFDEWSATALTAWPQVSDAVIAALTTAA